MTFDEAETIILLSLNLVWSLVLKKAFALKNALSDSTEGDEIILRTLHKSESNPFQGKERSSCMLLVFTNVKVLDESPPKFYFFH